MPWTAIPANDHNEIYKNSVKFLRSAAARSDKANESSFFLDEIFDPTLVLAFNLSHFSVI
jgi:hypothetical protein